MLQILFICYFCFYFTFAVYTNVLDTVAFLVRKEKYYSTPMSTRDLRAGMTLLYV